MIDATIKINFGPGSDIENSFIEAVRISKLLGVYTEFQFNGVTCIGRPDGDPSIGVRAYHDLASNKRDFKLAIAFPNPNTQISEVDPVETKCGLIDGFTRYTQEVWVNHYSNGKFDVYENKDIASFTSGITGQTVKATLTYDIPMTKV